jgi:hypothetical protein
MPRLSANTVAQKPAGKVTPPMSLSQAGGSVAWVPGDMILNNINSGGRVLRIRGLPAKDHWMVKKVRLLR